MQYNRRNFLKFTGAVGTGLVLNSLGSSSLFAAETAKPISQFGIQLYTLRDVIPGDPKGVLKQLASFGYKQIESYEGAKGMFWGMGHTGFKNYMDELGMKIVSSHCDITKDFEKKAAEAAEIGMKYLICPWKGPQKSLDDFKRFADEFNQKGEICKKNGIRFAYHNHDYSFKAMDGQLPQDVMMNGTDPSLVDFEMDIYWVAAAGVDIEAWFKNYKKRFRLCHVKDRSKNPGTDNGKNSVDLGTGSIDWPTILKSAKKYGMQYYIVEQEAYPNGSSLEAAKVNADYMKTVKI
ncbi:MAG TPA: TIM barrel protein [Chitinophagaceae bacterium]|nr:TIM barrel protein [Chitinophagaceae bacterium]HPH30765.1 TIM barrel protein [Chitinophagaceae bacterium]HPN58445.1 TIM barrel protein [Chitinophagaceae bacterium]